MISHIFANLFHILFVSSLFLYIGINRTKTPIYILNLLKYLGIIIILYHSYQAYNKIIINKSAWINFFHIFVVGPLLVIIGINELDTSRKYFEFLLMLGIASLGYHTYYLTYNIKNKILR